MPKPSVRSPRLPRRCLTAIGLALSTLVVIAQKPAPPSPEVSAAVLATDHEFDAGSRIALKALSRTQVANLVTLGKVWGFVKYHHPAVAAGTRHWDYDLFRVMPRVLAAASAGAAQGAMAQWIRDVGPVPDCDPCVTLDEKDLHLRPPATWLTDARLGTELAGLLRTVHRNRAHLGSQLYVSLAPGVGNPLFDRELPYPKLTLPDAGYQLLALFRFWNIVEYWFPYRDVIGRNWDEVLTAFVPRIGLAGDSDTFQRELMALIATVNDTHANLWSSLGLRPPAGECEIPVALRFVEKQAVVTGYAHAESGPGTGLQVGDVVESMDGAAVAALVERWSPYYAASNEPTRLRDIARSMTRGPCGPASVRIRRNDSVLDLRPERIAVAASGTPARRTHDRPGDTFQKLSAEVAYLKLSSVQAGLAASYVESAAGTRGLVIDIRNYPGQFVVFALGSRLVERPTEFARFTVGSPQNPGAFRWTPPLRLEPASPRYTGKVAILVDESSQSQAEYTAMAFRAAPHAVVVGSTTAGADGNVSPILLPGGFRAMISGIGVFYPDKTPTQRIGIIPDIPATPTIRGIRSGRDEVLEAALRHILGPDVPPAEIERMARRP